jgi:hypothetical protein
MVVGLLLFIVLFGTGPFLLAKFHKTKITVKRLKIFCAAYDLLALLVLNSLFIQKSATYFPMATILMCNVISIVFAWASYRILKQHLKKARWLGAYLAAIPEEHYIQQESEMNTFTVDAETGEVVKEEPKSTPVSFSQPVETCSVKKRRLSFSTILLFFVCAVFAFVLFEFSYYARNAEATKAELLEKIEGLESEKAKLVHQKSAIQQERDELKREIDESNIKDEKTDKELDFCRDRISLLVDQLWGIGYIVDGSKYYHRFECEVYTSADEYWAHNVEYCEYLGYSRCPICWDFH